MVAFVLLRMAWGGSIGGIIYVIHVNHPAVLLAGAVTIIGAIAAAALLLAGATSWGLAISIVLGVFAAPFALVLMTQDHGSAPVMGLAALVALALSARATLRSGAPTTPGV